MIANVSFNKSMDFSLCFNVELLARNGTSKYKYRGGLFHCVNWDLVDFSEHHVNKDRCIVRKLLFF